MSIIYVNPYQFAAAYDADAQSYITYVEAADGQTLEVGVRDAINAFVVGCKADGIWSAIKASCILAGARTLNGALVPLVGTAPTNYNFVAGDYNRKTGLVGDKSTKYLDSNRNNNADPQNSKHLAIYSTNAPTNDGLALGASTGSVSGRSGINVRFIFGVTTLRVNSSGSFSVSSQFTNFIGGSRGSSGSFEYRVNSISGTAFVNSQVPINESIGVFATAAGLTKSDIRLAFYSIGESLDLAALDTRVSALITAIGAAIP